MLTSPNHNNTVAVTLFDLVSCAQSAAPKPGWNTCKASMGLFVSMTVTSGYVSAYVEYPEAGAYYHGETQVQPGTKPGDITIDLVNPYVSKCEASYPTTVQVFDGRDGDQNARLLKKVPFTIQATC